jgi:hypothetical protein
MELMLYFGSQLRFHLQVRESTKSGGSLRRMAVTEIRSKGSTRLVTFPYLKMEAVPASKTYSIKN